MGLVVEIILLVIAGLTYAISGGFATDAARRTANIPGYSSNPKLTSAHKWLTVSAILVWISIALLLVGIVLLIFFAPEEAAAAISTGSDIGKYVFYFLIFLILGGVITVGILSAIAANDINKAGIIDDDGAAKQATIAACIAIPVFVIIFVILIVMFTHKPKPKTSTLPSNLQFPGMDEIPDNILGEV